MKQELYLGYVSISEWKPTTEVVGGCHYPSLSQFEWISYIYIHHKAQLMLVCMDPIYQKANVVANQNKAKVKWIRINAIVKWIRIREFTRDMIKFDKAISKVQGMGFGEAKESAKAELTKKAEQLGKKYTIISHKDHTIYSLGNDSLRYHFFHCNKKDHTTYSLGNKQANHKLKIYSWLRPRTFAKAIAGTFAKAIASLYLFSVGSAIVIESIEFALRRAEPMRDPVVPVAICGIIFGLGVGLGIPLKILGYIPSYPATVSYSSYLSSSSSSVSYTYNNLPSPLPSYDPNSEKAILQRGASGGGIGTVQPGQMPHFGP